MVVKNDQDAIIDYLSDTSNLQGNTSAVYFPESVDELIELVQKCYRTNMPITIAGAMTGTTGGSVPLGGIVISLSYLDKIIHCDEEESTVRIQPGLLLKDLQDFLAQTDLFYPPNPTENNSMMGGNIATNASGSRTLKYGSTRDYIEELTILFANGETCTLSRNDKAIGNLYSFLTDSNTEYAFTLPDISMPAVKNASGYFIKDNMDLIDLFIGSEGTLGIIVEAKLRLCSGFQHKIGGIAFFESYLSAFNFVDEVKLLGYDPNTRIDPAILEFYDNASLDVLRSSGVEIPELAQSAIWFEQESQDEEDELLSELYEIISKHSALAEETRVAMNESQHRDLTNFRHALPLAVNEKLAHNAMKKISTDTAVPDHNFRELYTYNIELLAEIGIEYIIFGHIGDAHLHINLFPTTAAEQILAKQFYMKSIQKTLELKGTVSAEHGIGKIKKEYLTMMYGETVIVEMRKIKNILDHKNILNNGNLF